MKDEIKEILNKLEKYESIINVDEEKLLLDYITNLQEENDRLNNIIDELEKWICQQISATESCEVFEAKAYNNQLVEVYKRDKRQYKLILNKLKELKEGE